MTDGHKKVSLILGTGEVGTAIARLCGRRGLPLAIHCRRDESAELALRQLNTETVKWKIVSPAVV